MRSIVERLLQGPKSGESSPQAETIRLNTGHLVPYPDIMNIVLFDLGGVLVRISRSWAEAAERAEVTLPEDQSGTGSLVRPAGNQAELQRGLIDYDEFIDREHERLEARLDRDALHRIHMEWLQGEYEGVAEIIDNLKRAGVRTGTLSNTDAEHWKVLAEMPAIRALDVHALSFRLGLLKPSTDIYHAAEDLLDATGPSICYFDDLQENVEGALRCGWNARWIDPHEATAPQIARGLEAFGVAQARD